MNLLIAVMLVLAAVGWIVRWELRARRADREALEVYRRSLDRANSLVEHHRDTADSALRALRRAEEALSTVRRRMDELDEGIARASARALSVAVTDHVPFGKDIVARWRITDRYLLEHASREALVAALARNTASALLAQLDRKGG